MTLALQILLDCIPGFIFGGLLIFAGFFFPVGKRKAPTDSVLKGASDGR